MTCHWKGYGRTRDCPGRTFFAYRLESLSCCSPQCRTENGVMLAAELREVRKSIGIAPVSQPTLCLSRSGQWLVKRWPSMALLRASRSPCLDKLALTAGHSTRRKSDNKHDSTKVASQACGHFCGLNATLRSCAPSFECSAAPSSESSMGRSNYCIHLATNTKQKQSIHTSREPSIDHPQPLGSAPTA
jgi:hypothetical protein